MALPLLIPVAIGLAGLLGVGKTVKAVRDTSRANDIAGSAQYKVDRAEDLLESTKNLTNNKLLDYGIEKVRAYEINIQKFVDAYSQLKNVEIQRSEELERLQIGDFSEVTIGELRHSCSLASAAGLSLGSGAAGGAAIAFGAYNGTLMLAAAGTGTAISTLSGVAATNATLAWLGGGTLAAGGFGIVGGTMVLGTLVAGPALLIFGSVLGASAEKKLDEAYSNMEKAKTYEKEIEGVCAKLSMIQEVTQMASETLSALRTRTRRANDALEKIIRTSGTDFIQYTQEEKNTVFQSVKCVQILKAVIDTPILNEGGNVVDGSKNMFTNFKNALELG